MTVPRKSRSSIDALGVTALVENLLEANATYAEIQQTVKEQTGQDISIGALSRFRTKWSAAQERLARAGADANALASVLLDHPVEKMADAGMGMLFGKLVQKLASTQEAFETADLLEVGKLLVTATRAKQRDDLLAIQRDRLDLMKQKVSAAAEKVKTALTEAGASSDRVVELVDEILGVTA